MEVKPRSFLSRHLGKLLMTPLVGLFAAGLTVALLIAFPPAGFALTVAIFIGAGIAAGAVGAGLGFGAGALVDVGRRKDYQRGLLESEDYTRSDANALLRRGFPITKNSGSDGQSIKTEDQPDDSNSMTP